MRALKHILIDFNFTLSLRDCYNRNQKSGENKCVDGDGWTK